MKRIYDNAIDKNVAKVVLFIGDDDKIYYTDPAEDENAQEVPAEEALNLFLKEMVGFKSSDGTYVNPVSCTTEGELSFESSGGGGSSGALIINVDFTGALNKTWQEIYDTIKGGNMAVIVVEHEEGGQIVAQGVDIIKYASLDTSIIPNEYIIETGNSFVYKTNSHDGYPVGQD